MRWPAALLRHAETTRPALTAVSVAHSAAARSNRLARVKSGGQAALRRDWLTKSTRIARPARPRRSQSREPADAILWRADCKALVWTAFATFLSWTIYRMNR